MLNDLLSLPKCGRRKTPKKQEYELINQNKPFSVCIQCFHLVRFDVMHAEWQKASDRISAVKTG